MAVLKILAIAVGLIAVCFSGASADPQHIRVTLQLPEGSELYQSIASFKDSVEKELKGTVNLQIFPSAQLFKPNEVIGAVESGAIEMGAVLLTAYADRVPATSIFSLPFMFNTDALLRAATFPESGIRGPIDKAILKKTGARVLWWVSSGASVILSNGGPVLTPTAIGNKTVRVSGPQNAELVSLCGGKPVEIGGDQQYDAYKSGKAEIGMTGLNVVTSRHLWEVMDTVAITNHFQAEFVLIINDEVWRSLSPEQQKIFERAARASDKFYRTKVLELGREGLDLARQKGMKVYDISAGEIKEWKDCATPMLTDFLSKSGTLGQTVIAGYRQILVEAYRTPQPR